MLQSYLVSEAIVIAFKTIVRSVDDFNDSALSFSSVLSRLRESFGESLDLFRSLGDIDFGTEAGNVNRLFDSLNQGIETTTANFQRGNIVERLREALRAGGSESEKSFS